MSIPKTSHAYGAPWVWGEPDMRAPFIGADTEFDTMDANDVHAPRAGYSLSDGVRGIFKTDEPHLRHSGHGADCCRQIMPDRVFLHSAKADLHRLGLDPDDLDSWDDTLLMAYCLRLYDRLGLKELAPMLTGVDWPTSLKDLLKVYEPSGETFKSGKRKGEEKPGKWRPVVFSHAVKERWDDASRYAATDAVATSRLAEVLTAQMAKAPGARAYYENYEKPLVPVLLSMETAGIAIDQQALMEAASVIDERRRTTEIILNAHFPSGINMASGQQMGPILYDMGIVDGAMTPTGDFETGKPAILRAFDIDRIEELPDTEQGRLAGTYLEWKQMGKLKSTYVDAILERLDGDGRIHPRFNSASTVTNRLSSSNPNFQNIPTRTKVGAAIRRAVVASRGNVLVGGDFAGLQLRIFGEMTSEPAFLEAFKPGGDGDFHGYVARLMGRPRSVIKNFVFATLFGAAPRKAAQTAGVPESQAAAFMQQLYREVPSLLTWQQQTQDLLAANGGWVETLMGWRMVYPDFGSKNNRRHAAAIREASNGRIQGTEAGYVKAFMIELYARLNRLFPRWQLLLVVHDEVWAEGPPAEAEDVRRLMVDTANDVALRYFSKVPMVFDVKPPLANWGEAKG